MLAFIIAEALLALGFRKLAQEPAYVPPKPKAVQGCLKPSLYSASATAPAPVFNVLNDDGRAALEGANLYLTPAGQDAVMGQLSFWILTPPNDVAMSRQTAIRLALINVFPECSWWMALENYSSAQYQVWISANAIASALEADAGKSLKAAPRSGSSFIHRQDIGLGSAAIGGLPVGDTILLNAADASGDNAELAFAEVTSPVDQNFEQEVKIQTPVAMSDIHGVEADAVYRVSTPWYTMSVVKEAQAEPNPRITNPSRPRYYPLLGL